MGKRRFRCRPKFGPKPTSNYIAKTQKELYKKRGAREMPIAVTSKVAFRFSEARITRVALFGRQMPGWWLIKKIIRKVFPPPQIPNLSEYRVVEFRGDKQIVQKGGDQHGIGSKTEQEGQGR
jgi:hypothetical protein